MVGLIREKFGSNEVIKGAEVGVSHGNLSVSLLTSFPQLFLWMIDPYELLWEDGDNPTMPVTVEQAKAERECAKSATGFAEERRIVLQMFSVLASEFLNGTRLDFVFVDANHMYEPVREDVEAWWPTIREGGFISGHDYNGVGDRRKGWGVKRAVDERFGDAVNVLPGLVWWVEKK
jgi:hypothetical protein